MSGSVSRLVVVPAWGSPDGPWTLIRDNWPGPVETFLGSGLGDEPAAEGWSLEAEASEVAEVIGDADVLCGTGWAASTALLAAAQRALTAVVLYAPPLGLDLSGVAAGVHSIDDARQVMSAFGGSAEYWDHAQQATNFVERAVAYLSQNVAAATSAVRSPIIAAWPEKGDWSPPSCWTSLTCEPAALPARVADVIALSPESA